MLTCREFLSELNAYLDESTDGELKLKLDDHMTQCPNCWVVADTTKKTIQIYRGTEPRALPDTLKFRLLAALEARMKARHKTI